MFLILTCVVFPGSYIVNQLSRSPSQARHRGAGRGILRCAGEWPGVSRGQRWSQYCTNSILAQCTTCSQQIRPRQE